MTQQQEFKTSVDALCMQVLERNKQRNRQATRAKKERNFAHRKTPSKLHSVAALDRSKNGNSFPCGTCLYFGWVGVEKYCRHPNHNRLIAGAGCKGLDHIDRDLKLSPTASPSWLAPVALPV